MSIILVTVITGVLPVFTGCSTVTEGFAIYLTSSDIQPTQMPELKYIALAAEPLIDGKDIINYNAQTHELSLTAGALTRISALAIPVRGKSFVVCVDKKPVYWGAFWTPISSISFDGVTVWVPYLPDEPGVITFQLGYPSPSFYGGNDPRNSPEILQSLRQTGKLIDRLSITDVNTLPHSMKGYELYSWSDGGRWQFTLITGTNRNKTIEEIVSKEDSISAAGWVNVHAGGVAEITYALGKLPANEFVTWLPGARSAAGSRDVALQLPPAQIINQIVDFARQQGLDFYIQS
jgi:hypothetical protein